MTDRTSDAPDAAIADARSAYLEGGRSTRGRTLLVALLLIAFAAAALLIFAGGTIHDMLTRGASDVEDMQETTGTDPGLDTGFNDPPALETGPVDTGDPFPPETGPSPEARRIAELERELGRQRQELLDAFDSERDSLQRQIDQLRNRPVQMRRAGIIPGTGTGETEAERRARERREAEEARLAAIREAQIGSEGVVIDGASNVRGSGGSAARGAGRSPSDAEAFMEDASTQGHETAEAGRIPLPGRTIVQGTTVPAVLETAVSSELPGVMRAVVTRDVHSYDGANVLLPKGSRLIGEYNSDVSVVQGRVQMAWSRAITPTGVSVELGGYGSDHLGRSGQAGFVDSRFRARFGSAALISLIGAGPQVLISENAGETEEDIAEDVGGDLERATQGVMEEYLGAPPVIYIDQGVELTVFVNRDLVF